MSEGQTRFCVRLAGCLWALAGGFGVQAAEPAPQPRHATLQGKVMCGYQGWFRTPCDEAQAGWRHYLRQRDGAWLPTTDYLPDVSEAAPEERCRMPLACADGRVAEALTSDSRATVGRHFSWMRRYGIDGAFVQRFPVDLYRRNLAAQPFRGSADRVLGYCRDAAASNGCAYALMYDLSGLGSNAAEVVIADWRHLVETGVVRGPSDSAWQHHEGRPVIALWGVGFNDKRNYGLDACDRLVEFFKREAGPGQGGYAVLLGLPFYWRTLKNDAVADARLHAVVRKADIVHTWSVGRYRDDAGVRRAEAVWREDAAWCRASGLTFMPVVFPGFSWKNLKGSHDEIPRRDGIFLWSQFAAARRAGAGCAFVAMFDEVDEGTQIFKVNNTPPAGAGFAYQSYGALPSDHYLWLTGEAARLFRSGQPLPEGLPARK